jgi:RHS repeat-associated protein
MPFGQVRTDVVNKVSQTDYGYTGQRNMDAQGSAYSLGLMDYRVRFYSASLGRFTQADTIVPGAGNPQAWNRYTYASNNPILHNDPTGHCVDGVSTFICAALIGGAIGFVVSYGAQTIENYNSGMSLSDAANIKNIDKGKLISATVGGLVAGGTMGLAAPALASALSSEVAAYMLAGAVSNTAGGAAESITDATIKQTQDGSRPWGLDNSGMNEFFTDAQNSGLTWGNTAYDFGSGGLLSLGAYGVVRPLTGPISKIPNAMFFDDLYYQSQGYLVGPSAETVKIISDTVQQSIQEKMDLRITRNNKIQHMR